MTDKKCEEKVRLGGKPLGFELEDEGDELSLYNLVLLLITIIGLILAMVFL